MQKYEKNYASFNLDEKLEAVRCAIIDDPITATMAEMAAPLVADMATYAGKSALEWMTSWWNGESDSSGSAIVPYDPVFAQNQISSVPGTINPVSTLA